jgi:hypothetical protein
MIFNVFVMMTKFNEINMRKLDNQRNVFQDIFGNPIFWYVMIITIIAQIILIEFGGIAFGTSGLTVSQWFICIAFGASTMVWHQIIIFIPCDWIPNGDRSEDPIQNIQAVGPRPSNSLHRTTSRTQTLERVVSRIVDGVHSNRDDQSQQKA